MPCSPAACITPALVLVFMGIEAFNHSTFIHRGDRYKQQAGAAAGEPQITAALPAACRHGCRLRCRPHRRPACGVAGSQHPTATKNVERESAVSKPGANSAAWRALRPCALPCRRRSPHQQPRPTLAREATQPGHIVQSRAGMVTHTTRNSVEAHPCITSAARDTQQPTGVGVLLPMQASCAAAAPPPPPEHTRRATPGGCRPAPPVPTPAAPAARAGSGHTAPTRRTQGPAGCAPEEQAQGSVWFCRGQSQ